MKKAEEKAGCDLCERCDHFDNSHHVKDSRTAHAGICKRWASVTWKTETCREFINGADLGTWDEVTMQELESTPSINQLKLF